MVAVKHENDSNPIVRSVAHAYLFFAQRYSYIIKAIRSIVYIIL